MIKIETLMFNDADIALRSAAGVIDAVSEAMFAEGIRHYEYGLTGAKLLIEEAIRSLECGMVRGK